MKAVSLPISGSHLSDNNKTGSRPIPQTDQADADDGAGQGEKEQRQEIDATTKAKGFRLNEITQEKAK